METDDLLRILYAVGLLILVWPAIRAIGRNRRRALDYVLIWVFVVLALALSYSVIDGMGLLPDRFR